MTMTSKQGRMRPLVVDTAPFSIDSAKRDLEATAWAVALAAPGLFAGLGQVSNLFKATRFPSMFGYYFGLMILMLLLSVFFGLRNYRRLQLIVGLNNTMQFERTVRDAKQAWVLEEWKEEHPNVWQIDKYSDDIAESYVRAAKTLNTLTDLHNAPEVQMSIHQRLLLEYAYVIFILIIVSSDFSKLL